MVYAGQEHTYELPITSQVPPFVHEEGEHGSTKRYKTCIYYNDTLVIMIGGQACQHQFSKYGFSSTCHIPYIVFFACV